MKIFIPIKHLSQRVEGKNFRDFGGEPLFKHTLLKYVDDEVYVDTDSEKVIDLIRGDHRLANVIVSKRKDELRGHEVSVCDLIQDFIKTNNIRTNIVQIHVTSPFLKRETILKASELMDKHDSVVACNVYRSRFWREETYGYCPVNHNPTKMEQTQDLPPLYEENSAFYIFDPNVMLKTNSRVGINPYFYGIMTPENIDIDIESDWNHAVGLREII
tara:strand:- start:13216 stop:13863 length:648 start_codon:yes stop_codon:yes gene_type:complete